VGLHSLRRIPHIFVFYEAQALCLYMSNIYDTPYEPNHNFIYLMDAIPLCFNIEVYVFTSIAQEKSLKYQLYFS
jgi:hypothetical protein